MILRVGFVSVFVNIILVFFFVSFIILFLFEFKLNDIKFILNFLRLGFSKLNVFLYIFEE